jgi:hypothetical protein
MLVTRLVPGCFYWARAKSTYREPTIVQVSTVFGEHYDFWTLAVVGSDEHHMPADFDIIARVTEPAEWETSRQAAE